jgi:uncharacterized membrane protein YqiK
MRADAYKQFNEAAIIQTVLSALPDIVRAAAEPMAHIDSLTVMSADGASDVVRNATRAMIESTTAIKGLTGLDVPNLIGGALGKTVSEKPRDGGGAGQSAAERISEIAGQGLTSMKTRAAEASAAAKAAADEAATKAKEEADKARAEAEKAKEAAAKVAAAAETKAKAEVARVVPADGNIKQWAAWMADQLRRVPDIGVYGRLRLRDLADHGPATARGVWATAKDVLTQDYGNTTIDDLMAQFPLMQH